MRAIPSICTFQIIIKNLILVIFDFIQNTFLYLDVKKRYFFTASVKI